MLNNILMDAIAEPRITDLVSAPALIVAGVAVAVVVAAAVAIIIRAVNKRKKDDKEQ